LPDQIFLASGPVVPNDLAELRIVALDGFPTGVDQGLEATAVKVERLRKLRF
jgi:hypothetical protein